jgi:hypothetical protein
MKLFYHFFTIFIFISSTMHAQNTQDRVHAKPSEQKEIKATNHLKKELEQKQLSAPPERMAVTKDARHHTVKKKNKKCKAATWNKRNKQSE